MSDVLHKTINTFFVRTDLKGKNDAIISVPHADRPLDIPRRDIAKILLSGAGI